MSCGAVIDCCVLNRLLVEASRSLRPWHDCDCVVCEKCIFGGAIGFCPISTIGVNGFVLFFHVLDRESIEQWQDAMGLMEVVIDYSVLVLRGCRISQTYQC